MVWGSDDDESYYEELTVPAAPASRRSTSRLRVQIDDDHYRQPSPARSERRRGHGYHHHSYQAAPQSAVDGPDNIIIENHLNLPQPQFRPRSSSTGAPPQPNYLHPIYVQPSPRERSRERVKGYEEEMSPEIAKKLAKLELLESERERISPATAEKLMRLRMYEENNRRDQVSPEVAEKLARLRYMEEEQKRGRVSPETAAKLERLRYMEERRARDAEEAAIEARVAEQSRAEKQRREAAYLEYKQKQQEQEAEEREAIDRAEAKRLKEEARAKAERDRLLAAEKDRQEQEKIERDRIIAMERDREDREEAERLRIISEERVRSEKKKKEAEEERRRIILEEEERKKKEKDEHEELRKKILAEEEEKERERKAKEKAEEDEFQMRVKERFMKHGKLHSLQTFRVRHTKQRPGYSPDYIEDILENKKALVRKTSTRRAENQLAIEGARPTYIRVQVRHLYPETLNEYELPWEYDPSDDRYILIKEYISHELQQELFEHTKRIKVRREKLLITDGYVKKTETTIKPKDVYKDSKSDDMFIMRRKSQNKSPRRSWMFT